MKSWYVLASSVYRLIRFLVGRRVGAINVEFFDFCVEGEVEDDLLLRKSSSGLPSVAMDITSMPSHHEGGREAMFFPVENPYIGKLPNSLSKSFQRSSSGIKTGCSEGDALDHWLEFISKSRIPVGYRNGGFHFGGYIGGGIGSWCLPSWIWTNAALGRCYLALGYRERGLALCEKFLSFQLDEGGWIVRNDYSKESVVPVIAPNDSAYIANNALLSAYRITEETRYLEAAKRCADWIMETRLPSGLVATGMNASTGEWLLGHTIVDTGFTAAFFAELFAITKEPRYLQFLRTFAQAYVEAFFVAKKGGFATSISYNGKQIGGRFARGQAWALEGLISTYRVTNDQVIASKIDETVSMIVSKQHGNGGWSYNFDRSFLGEDCKGVPVIAKALAEWGAISGRREAIRAAEHALDWCCAHTSVANVSRGGIFCFSAEGAIVHNHYTSTALVYSSAYALETKLLVG